MLGLTFFTLVALFVSLSCFYGVVAFLVMDIIMAFLTGKRDNNFYSNKSDWIFQNSLNNINNKKMKSMFFLL
jgi:ABC-type lipoprotein release transport system permease subunit